MKKIFVVMFVAALTMLTAGMASADTLSPIADAPTYNGLYAGDVNFNNFGFGLDSALWSGIFQGSYDARSYLKFDLTPYSSIQSASLWLYKGENYMGAANVTSYGTSNLWTETGITWNSQPALGTAGATTNVGSGLGWYSWDVTSLANLSTGGNFSLALASTGVGQLYYQRETQTGNTPYLNVTAVPEPISTILFLTGGTILAVRRLRMK